MSGNHFSVETDPQILGLILGHLLRCFLHSKSKTWAWAALLNRVLLRYPVVCQDDVKPQDKGGMWILFEDFYDTNIDIIMKGVAFGVILENQIFLETSN